MDAGILGGVIGIGLLIACGCGRTIFICIRNRRNKFEEDRFYANNPFVQNGSVAK